MRLVCKAWYGFVNHFEPIEKLCVYEQVVPYKLKWSSDCTDVRGTIKVNASKLDFSKDPFFKGLRRLYIYKLDKHYKLSMLECLNSLTNLEELCFDSGGLYNSSSVNVNLANLKTFTMKSIQSRVFVLNTPRLENLRIGHIVGPIGREDSLHLLHPNSIRSLRIDSGFFYRDYSKFTKLKFPNLRRLVIGDYYDRPADRLKLDLEHLPKLKSIELFTRMPFLNLKESIEKFIKRMEEQRSMLGRSDPVILVNGFRETHIENCFEVFSKRDSLNLSVVWGNFDKMVGDYLNPVEFNLDDYLLLREYCPAIEERRKFISRFRILKRIQAYPIPDPELLLEFLIEWGTFVEFLYLKNPGLFFSRYGQRLAEFKNLRYLQVVEWEMNTNYDFLLNMTCLETFSLRTLSHFCTPELENVSREIFKQNPDFKHFWCSDLYTRKHLKATRIHPSLSFSFRLGKK